MMDIAGRDPRASQPPPRPARRDDVEEASMESFPASDAPSWTSLRVGTPREDRTRREGRPARGRPTEGDG